MFIYQNKEINYKYHFVSHNAETIIYLHGWGQNKEMMEPIAIPFLETENLLLIDLPGFGKSEEPNLIWSLEDYADMIFFLQTKLEIKNPILIGHSFGGKVSIVYASKYKTKKLILIGSPYKPSQKKVSLKVKILKKMAKISFLKKWAEKTKQKMGSTDYKMATPKMRSIMVKHLNTDTTELCKKIKSPTLILWGTKDTAVSLENAYELESLISDAAVILYEGKSHYAYLEDLNKTNRILHAFIKEEKL